jgi:hypothetical protein
LILKSSNPKSRNGTIHFNRSSWAQQEPIVGSVPVKLSSLCSRRKRGVGGGEVVIDHRLSASAELIDLPDWAFVSIVTTPLGAGMDFLERFEVVDLEFLEL